LTLPFPSPVSSLSVGERIQVRGPTCNRSMAYAKLNNVANGTV